MLRLASSLLRNWNGCSRGSAAIEGALTLPFLIAAGLGTIDGSLLMLQNHKMEQALSLAGSYLARSDDPETHEDTAKSLAVHGTVEKPTADSKKTIENWSVDQITITYNDTKNTETQGKTLYRGGETIRVVKLSGSVDFKGLGFLNLLFDKDVKITAEYEERIPGYIG